MDGIRISPPARPPDTRRSGTRPSPQCAPECGRAGWHGAAAAVRARPCPETETPPRSPRRRPGRASPNAARSPPARSARWRRPRWAGLRRRTAPESAPHGPQPRPVQWVRDSPASLPPAGPSADRRRNSRYSEGRRPERYRVCREADRPADWQPRRAAGRCPPKSVYPGGGGAGRGAFRPGAAPGLRPLPAPPGWPEQSSPHWDYRRGCRGCRPET